MDITINGVSWDSKQVAALSYPKFVSDYAGAVTYVPDAEKQKELEHIYEVCVRCAGEQTGFKTNNFGNQTPDVGTDVPSQEGKAPINTVETESPPEKKTRRSNKKQ